MKAKVVRQSNRQRSGKKGKTTDERQVETGGDGKISLIYHCACAGCRAAHNSSDEQQPHETDHDEHVQVRGKGNQPKRSKRSQLIQIRLEFVQMLRRGEGLGKKGRTEDPLEIKRSRWEAAK